MNGFNKRVTRGAAAAMLVLTGAVAGHGVASAQAGQEARSFDIPAGSLGSALARLGRQAGVLVTVNGDLIRSRRSPGLRGTYSPHEAIDRLLEGTGLRAERDARGGFTVRNAGLSESDTEIIVTGTPESRYVSQNPQTGSRIEKTILDTPRTVDAIPEQVLRDQHIRELSEIYRYSANVVNNDGYGGTREDYIIRGFRRRDDVYRDGVRMKTNGIVDPSTVASVEILKGPTSDIGQMTPGGLVNIITKKPQIKTYNHAEFNIDNRGERQAYADFTGGFANDRFAYRLTGSYDNGHTFRDDSGTRRSFVSGSLSWFGDAGAKANLTYEHGDDNRPLDRGFATLPVPGSTTLRFVPDLDRGARMEPAFSRRRSIYNLATADVAVPVADGWQVEGKLLYNNERTDEVHTEVRSIAANGTLTRQVQGNFDRDLTTWFGRVQVKGEGTLLFPFKLVFGTEYRKQRESWLNFTGANQVFGTLFDLRSNEIVNDSDRPLTQVRRAVDQEDYGPYVQTDIQLAEALTLTLGGRYEFFRGDFVNQALLGPGTASFSYPTDQKFTKSAALTYKPAPGWTLYANYSDTFQPQSFYENSTQFFPPQNGRMVELGAKKALFEGKLLLTAAWFGIKQDNLVEVTNGQAFLSGGQTSRGVELAAIGSPARGLNVRAGFGYADAKVVSRNPATDGQLPTNVPKYNANAYVSYEVRIRAVRCAAWVVGLGWSMHPRAMATSSTASRSVITSWPMARSGTMCRWGTGGRSA